MVERPERGATDAPSRVRADVWLWAARFFKTRRLAHEALGGGKVEANGAACKPARNLVVGDRLLVTRGEERFDIEVLALAERRGPASVAQTLYAETAASRAARAERREQARLARPVRPDHAPDKDARRELRRLKRGGSAP